jgi:predicted transcriptional regulator
LLAIDGRDKERKTLRATLKMIRDMRQNHSDYKIAQLATKLATEALAKTASRE